MDYRCLCRFARISPTKVRHVADLIRGKTAAQGLAALKYLPHRGARFVEKVLKSAMANAEDRGVRNADGLRISEVKIDGGPMFKRIVPHSRGMGFVIRKRFSHITVAVSDE
jgi:large subunit ribosomal protein L22